MKKVLAVVLMGLACVAAYAETDYTVERKVDYLWRHIMGGGGSGGDYPTKEWVTDQIDEVADAVDALDSTVVSIQDDVSAHVSDVDDNPHQVTLQQAVDADSEGAGAYMTNTVMQIINGLVLTGWDLDGAHYKLVVQGDPYDSIITLSNGVREVVGISGTLGLSWFAEHGYYNGDHWVWIRPVTGVELGTDVTKIANQAFRGCASLKSVIIPDSVTSIGMEAFYGCSGLTSVTLPYAITRIADSTFQGCSGLTNVVFPAGLETIEYRAFQECSGLTEVVVPEGVLTVGELAFFGCSGLTNAVIPDSALDFKTQVFRDCTSLTSVTLPEELDCIPELTFMNCSSLQGVTIPEGVTNIESRAFLDCTGLLSLTIPEAVEEVGYNAFSGCSSLTNVTFEGRYTSELTGMFGHPWGVDSSILHGALDP